jgi:hypothetical protein
MRYKVKNYDRFSKLLDGYINDIKETLNTDIEIKWVDKKTLLIGLFNINNEVYQIFCKNYGEDVWSFKFQHFNKNTSLLSHDLTGFNHSNFSILSVVIKGFEYLINAKNPNAIVYGAGDESKGRKNLYSSFCNDISKKYNYEKINRLESNKQLFVNFKAGFNADILFDKIKLIVDDSFGIDSI